LRAERHRSGLAPNQDEEAMTDPQPPIPSNQDPKALATELAGLLGREKGGPLLEMARAHVLMDANKPGTQTSEFKLTVLGVCAGFAILALGTWKADPELANRGLDLVQWSIAGYAIARGIAKGGASKATK
jgi:hypothetical protein